MAKIRRFVYESGDVQYLYQCPGCGYEHAFGLKSDTRGTPGHHEFNMDYDHPVISPSLLQNFDPARICHSYINKGDGKIEYLSDCWHHLAGKTVELPDYDPTKLTAQP